MEHCDLYTLDVGVLDASNVMVLQQAVVVTVVGLERPASEVVVVVVFQTWLA